jgi:hypothetical protein
MNEYERELVARVLSEFYRYLKEPVDVDIPMADRLVDFGVFLLRSSA